MKKHIFIILICFQASLSGGLLDSARQEQFFTEMTEQLESVQSFKAEFEQKRFLSIMSEPLVSQGKCSFQVPDKLRWEITKPYSSILIYNEDQVVKFEIEKGKLKKLNFGSADMMRSVLQQIISWMQGDFRASEDLYLIQVTQDKNFIMLLTPKSDELRKNIQVIELHFEADSFDMQKVVIRESEQDYIQIGFNSKQENLVLPPKVFDLKKPLIEQSK